MNKKNIIKKLADKIGLDFTDETIKEHKLDGDSSKPYYMYFYWGSGSTGQFGDLQDIKSTLIDKLETDHKDGFRLIVFDTKTGDDISDKFAVDIKVTFNG